MIKPNSEYKISALRGLHPGLLGKTYSIVTATEVDADLIKAEYFLLVQLPTAALHHRTCELNLKNSPPVLERWDISSALDEAQFRVKIEVENLLEALADELNGQELDFLPFEFKSNGVNLMSPWSSGLFHSQIREIMRRTESLKLKQHLESVVLSPPMK